MDWFEIKSRGNYLFIAARNDNNNPSDGYIYRIKLNTSPLQVEIFNFDKGINGFDIDNNGNTCFMVNL